MNVLWCQERIIARMCVCCIVLYFVWSVCVVCCCDRVVLGFVCPYSSVVEHPLSKRKVGSSILLGGISLCYTHRLCLVFNTKPMTLFWPLSSLYTYNIQHTTTPSLQCTQLRAAPTRTRSSTTNYTHPNTQLSSHFLF